MSGFRYGCLAVVTVLLITLAGCAHAPAGKTAPATEGEVRARIELAESHIAKAEYRRSLQELLIVERQAQDSTRLHYNLGITYMGLKEWSRAVDALERTVTLDPEHGAAWNLLAQAHVAQNRMDKAVEAFKTSMSILSYVTPEYPAFNLAKLYQAQGNRELALQYARTSIDKNWRYTPAYLLTADLLLEQGKTEEALALLTRGAEADPENAELLLRLAENHLRLGHTDEARTWFQHILTIAPQSKAAKVAEDYLDLTR